MLRKPRSGIFRGRVKFNIGVDLGTVRYLEVTQMAHHPTVSINWYGIFSNQAKAMIMTQMKGDGLETVDVNFEDPELPDNVRELRPLVWHDGNNYCAVLGPDQQTGVFACGNTVEKALEDWNWKVQERMIKPKAGDEVADFIRGVLCCD